ncbi:MAG: RsmD family RNA methyltransferase [Alphaproteobacteria bacterium]|nr:RsmD family RNA methyltransferase [Alphaproteobacteria bacterium]
MLRILQGKYRNRRLILPPPEVVRPMGQRMREAIFNILRHRYACIWEGQSVLDVFAGSGSIGLEALSRGANPVFFIERSEDIVQNFIRKNVRDDENAVIINTNALAPYSLPCLVDVAFVDPPFGKDMVKKSLERVFPHMKEQSYIVVQQELNASFVCPPGWRVDAERIYTYKHMRILCRD